MRKYTDKYRMLGYAAKIILVKRVEEGGRNFKETKLTKDQYIIF